MTSPPFSSGDLALIVEAAQAAGRLALRLREAGLTTRRKPGGSPLTNGDLAVNDLLIERLRGARPDYAWLSEESADDPARLDARRLFIVDPIDGTTAYLQGRPWFAVAIAVVEDGRPTAAVVHAPALGETYAAARRGGATLNGAPIRPSRRDRLEDCAMLAPADTFTGGRWGEPWPPMRLERRNAIALRITLVAAGAFDATVSLGPKHDWDVAAASLIAEEAGALATDGLGARLRFNTPQATSPSLICAGPPLHRLILERVAPIERADGSPPDLAA